MFKLPRPRLADLLQALSPQQRQHLLRRELRRRVEANLQPLQPQQSPLPALLRPPQAKG